MNTLGETPKPKRGLDLGVWLISLTAAVLPLWVSDLLPFMDMPQHLATMRVLAGEGQPEFQFDTFYDWHLLDTQYLAYYLAVLIVEHVVELEVANRFILSLYAIGLPLSLSVYLKAHRRDPGVALLAVPLVFNCFLFMGFANYVCALPLVFLALAWLRQLMDTFSAGRWLALAGLTVVLFYSHAHAFLIYGLGAGITGLCGGRGFHPRHWWRQATHLLPAMGLMVHWALGSLILASQEQWEAGHGGRNVSPDRMRWEPLLDRLQAVPAQLLDVYKDDADEWLLLALILLIGGLLFGRDLAQIEEGDERLPRPRRVLRALVPELIMTGTFIAYLFSPISYKWIWPLSHRMIPVVIMFSLGALAWRHLPRRPVLLLLPALILNITASSLHVERARAFDIEAGAIREVVRVADPGKRTLGLIFSRGSEVLRQSPYLHFAQYYVVERGGVASFSFVDFPQSPIRYRASAAPPRLPNRFEWTPERFKLSEHGAYYDYFLVRDGGAQRPRRLFERDRDSIELLKRSGRWALYGKR